MYRYMDLKIEEVLRGPSNLKALVVTGDNGSECRHYVTAFPVGTRWVLAISQYGGSSNLAISRCSVSALSYDGAAVTGVINLGPGSFHPSETIPLGELRLRLSAP